VRPPSDQPPNLYSVLIFSCRTLVHSVEGLSLLQHRGQDAAGVVTCGSGGRFYQVKSNGMVRDVFDSKAVAGLKGWMGVGHGELASMVGYRYPHSGRC
jgi:glutamine phosphoribosylpyrophosphate amidotransferase